MQFPQATRSASLPFRVDNKEKLKEPFSPFDMGEFLPTSATGSAGDKLYAIHIAPAIGQTPRLGMSESRFHEAFHREKCLHWVMEKMRRFPDRQPKPLKAIFEEARSLFPSLTERDFRMRIVPEAARQTGVTRWRDPGRLESPY
jgi:hypothetical protein